MPWRPEAGGLVQQIWRAALDDSYDISWGSGIAESAATTVIEESAESAWDGDYTSEDWEYKISSKTSA